MYDLRDVAVFWDIDTCPIPLQLSGFETVNKVRLLTQNFGIVKSFKGYGDLLALRTPSAFRLRSELQSSGVSLIDCPATEHRSVASTMMIVDLLTHIIDNSPATLVVIAGNSDFSYAVSILRLRQHRVILICPKDRVGPYSQASLYLDWFHDVLGDEYKVDDAPSVPHQQRPRSYTNSASPETSHPTAFALPPNQDVPEHVEPQMTLSTDTTEPSATTPPHEHEADPHQLEPVSGSGEGVPEGQQQSVVPPPDIETSKQEGEPGQPINSPMGLSLGDHVQRPSSAPPSYSSFSPAPSPLSYGFRPPAAPYPFTPTSPSFLNPPDEDGPSEHEFMQHGVEESIRPEHLPQSPLSTSTETVIPSPASTLTPLLAHVSPLTAVPPAPSCTATLEALTHSLVPTIPKSIPGPTPESLSASLVPTPQPSPLVMSKSVLPSVPTTPAPERRLGLPDSKLAPVPVAVSPMPAPALVSTAIPKPLTAHIPAPSVIPTHFQALVTILREYRAKGDHKPFRPSIAAVMMSSHNEDVQTAGAINFTQFAQLAEKAGVVELPEKKGEFWISLRPEL